MPLNIDWQQILLHLFNFTLLFAILYFLLYKPVKAFMEKREKEFADREAAADEKQTEAEQAKAEYEAKIEAVEAEIAERRRVAEEEASKQAAAIREAAAEEAGKVVAKARADAKEEHDKIIENARRELTVVVAEIAGKVVEASTSATYDAFLDAADHTAGEDHV